MITALWNIIFPESDGERSQLYASFPTVAKADLAPVLAVLPLTKQGQVRYYGDVYPVKQLISTDGQPVLFYGNQVWLPGRVYFAEPSIELERTLTARQRALLHAIYLRHYDGFVRQRRLEMLFTEPFEVCTVPFTFSLIGEYVQEIIEVLDNYLTPQLMSSYVQLIRENPLYWQKTKGRVASYWDVYYRIRRRGAPRFQHYVGARVLAKLQKALQKVDIS